ncbi:uncharacterized protein LOC126816525 [Patella vulgata]|uniref:uncharacterized protein LOC126816525 n=1 Tax=Patella vulgata TaxID=6465 RepID=UPI0024A99E82|nr:uncharacterized protein LOC126816525 [Patella vulgata]
MEHWNPLKDDYNDSEFNSYNKGPGRNLPKSDGVKSGVQLYVTGIPVNLRQDGLRNLFCQAGRVTHVKILPTKIPGSLDTFGFVTMASVKEATEALTRFHGFQIDRFRLKVQPCQTPEEQNRRKRIKEQDEAFLSTLNCGKINSPAANKDSDDTDDDLQTKKPSMNGVHKDEQLTEKLGKGRGRGSIVNSQDISVLDQSIVSHGPSSIGMNSSIDSLVDLTITVGNQQRQVCVDPDTVRRGSVDAGRSSRMSYAGSECSYSGHGVQTNVFRGRGYNRYNSSPTFVPGPSGDRLHHTMPQTPKSGKECLYCRKKAVKLCTRCKMPYCSAACQAADWPKHKTSCSKISTMPKEIDVEDFEVSIGEDIVEYFPPKDRVAIQQEYGDKIKTAYKKDQQVLETTEPIKPLKHSSPKKNQSKKSNSPRKPSGPGFEAPLLSDLPKLDLELNKDISTMVTHLDSPDSFFVCLIEDLEKSFSVGENLVSFYLTFIKIARGS